MQHLLCKLFRISILRHLRHSKPEAGSVAAAEFADDCAYELFGIAE
jgi:hypothetical protein